MLSDIGVIYEEMYAHLCIFIFKGRLLRYLSLNNIIDLILTLLYMFMSSADA